MEQPYTFLGFEIPQFTQIVGGALVLEGVGFYLGTGMESMTALIPVLSDCLSCFLASWRDVCLNAGNCSHIAVTFGLICALGGLMGIASLVQGDMGGSTYAQLIMLVIGSVYTFACVQSFIHARKAREAV